MWVSWGQTAPPYLDALDQHRVGDLKVQHLIHGDPPLGEHLVQHLRLRPGAYTRSLLSST